MAIALFVMEISARVDDVVTWGAPFWGPYGNNSLLQNDALGRWGKPGAQFEKWRLNRLGLRGPELRDDSTRVWVLGSSETFGLYEMPGHEYPRVLQGLLERSCPAAQIDIVNGGLAGLRIPTIMKRLPALLDAIRPAVVVIYAAPANYIVVPNDAETDSRAASAPEPVPATDYIRLYRRVRNLIKAVLPAAWTDRLRATRLEMDIRRLDHTVSRVPEENIQAFRADLESLLDALSTFGSSVVLVTHATRFGGAVSEGERHWLAAWRASYPLLEEDGFMDLEKRINAVVRQVSAERSLPLVDAARTMPAGSEYFADFVHFTDTGAAEMADELSDPLRRVLQGRGVCKP